MIDFYCLFACGCSRECIYLTLPLSVSHMSIQTAGVKTLQKLLGKIKMHFWSRMTHYFFFSFSINKRCITVLFLNFFLKPASDPAGKPTWVADIWLNFLVFFCSMIKPLLYILQPFSLFLCLPLDLNPFKVRVCELLHLCRKADFKSVNGLLNFNWILWNELNQIRRFSVQRQQCGSLGQLLLH